MATGNVSVRFSVQDGEVVRQALERLGKDGEAALRKLDAAGRAPQQSLNAVSVVAGKVKDQMHAFAGQAGTAGEALLTLGPKGLVAAAALGVLFVAFNRVSEGAKAFRQYAREVRDGAAQTGLAIPEFQAVIDLFARHGVETGKATASLNRFEAERYSATRGQGELYSALRSVNKGLADEFAAARTTAGALDVFSRAMAEADQTTRKFLERAAFGRSGAGITQAMQELAGKGGMAALTEEARRLGVAIDEGLIQKNAEATAAAERKAKIVELAWNSAYAAVFERWRDFKKSIGLDDSGSIQVAMVIKAAADGDTSAIMKVLGWIGTAASFVTPGGAAVTLGRRALPQPTTLAGDGSPVGAPIPIPAPGVPLPRARPVSEDQSELERKAAREKSLNDLRAEMAVLGQAATLNEQLALRERELQVAVDQGRASRTAMTRALDAFREVQAQAVVAARLQFGVASEEEVVQSKRRELYRKLADGVKFSAEEIAAAERLIQRTARETAEQLAVRNSVLPGLKAMEIEFGRIDKQLDQFSTGAVRDVASGLTDIAVGTKTVAQGASDMGLSVVRAITQMIIQMQIALPLARSLQAAFSAFLPGGSPSADFIGPPMPNAMGNAFGPHGLIRFASGGIVDRPTLFRFAHGTGLMGEAGPEAIIPLARDPAGRLGVRSSGSPQVVNNFQVIAPPGATVREERTPNATGGLDIKAFIDMAVADNMGRPGTQTNILMRNRFGIAPGLTRR